MIESPSVVAVDDNPEELAQIVGALRELDVACLPIRVQGANLDIKAPLRGVRVVFFDINYLAGVPNEAQMFEVAANVLLKVIAKDNGPYALITWSSKASTVHERLMAFFARDVEDAPAPAVTGSLQKEKFTPEGAAKDGGKSLRDEILGILTEQQQIRALMGWEIAAAQAAREVIDSLLSLFSREDRFAAKCGPELSRILRHLAVRAVGAENVDADRRAAMHEALVPILFDRLTHRSPTDEDKVVWASAFGEAKEVKGFTDSHGALLNGLIHVAYPNAGPAAAGDRGVVFTMPVGAGQLLADRAGVSLLELAHDFVDSHVKGADPGPPDLADVAARCRWVLLGTRAICDQAQAKGVMRPVVLGLEVPGDLKDKGQGLRRRTHGAIFTTPSFAVRIAAGQQPETRRLIVDWHWTTSLSLAEMAGATPLYRIREPLMGMIASDMSGYSSRPGIIEFD